MKAKESKATDEPIGIVVSGMPSAPTVTVFSAYVWGPAPATVEDDPKAA